MLTLTRCDSGAAERQVRMEQHTTSILMLEIADSIPSEVELKGINNKMI